LPRRLQVLERYDVNFGQYMHLVFLEEFGLFDEDVIAKDPPSSPMPTHEDEKKQVECEQ
jgi:hypothetical protein